ncbi:MAG: TatD family deoxyribonuclease [Verrucomicrobia bacterium]|nr:MAG: TatD family deoxyribonuclease [Verrucomicrobiota bacterium]
MLTDTHCHLASARYETTEVPAIIERAQAAGVRRLITLATDLEDLELSLDLAQRSSVYACIGIHPCSAHEVTTDVIETLRSYVSDPRVAAIGETGLDYFHNAPDGWTEENFRKHQRALLRAHFELASDAGLNVVIHTRDREGDQSLQDALAIYDDFRNNVRAVFHCFIQGSSQMQQVLDRGGIVSFGGVMTFKNAHMVRETARLAPVGSFMLETDSPYLAPDPFRSQRNEPAYLLRIAECLAQLRGESLDELAGHCEKTAGAFFRLLEK